MDSGMRMQQLKLNVRMMAQQLPLLQTQQLPVSTMYFRYSIGKGTVTLVRWQNMTVLIEFLE